MRKRPIGPRNTIAPSVTEPESFRTGGARLTPSVEPSLEGRLAFQSVVACAVLGA